MGGRRKSERPRRSRKAEREKNLGKKIGNASTGSSTTPQSEKSPDSEGNSNSAIQNLENSRVRSQKKKRRLEGVDVSPEKKSALGGATLLKQI